MIGLPLTEAPVETTIARDLIFFLISTSSNPDRSSSLSSLIVNGNCFLHESLLSICRLFDLIHISIANILQGQVERRQLCSLSQVNIYYTHHRGHKPIILSHSTKFRESDHPARVTQQGSLSIFTYHLATSTHYNPCRLQPLGLELFQRTMPQILVQIQFRSRNQSKAC